VENSAEILAIFIPAFVTLTAPAFSHILPIHTCYRVIHRGRRLTSYPTNNTHKYSITNRILFYSILLFIYPLKNIINTRRIDTIRRVKTLLTCMRVNGRKFVAMVT
jgi:hypothetical protein